MNDYISNRVFHFEHWEPNISNQIKSILRLGDVFVDVGANVGYDTLLASGIVGDHGTVYSIEASPRNFEILKANIKLNNLKNVRAVNMAASSEVGKLNIYRGPDHNKGRATTLEIHGFNLEASIDAAPIHEIVDKASLERIRLIKMDVEGAELPILHSIIDNLSLYSDKLDLIVEVGSVEKTSEWQEIFQLLKELGFHAYKLSDQYTSKYYVDWQKPQPLVEIFETPMQQEDVLFTRSPR